MVCCGNRLKVCKIKKYRFSQNKDRGKLVKMLFVFLSGARKIYTKIGTLPDACVYILKDYTRNTSLLFLEVIKVVKFT